MLSDAGGGYHIDHLWPVPYSVVASASPFEPASPQAEGLGLQVALRAGQEATGIDVILRANPSGDVHDRGGAVLEEALLRVGVAPGDPGFTTDAGLVVASVRADGSAVEAGLQVGDVIVSVDGHAVTGDARLFHSLMQVRAGTRLQLGLARGVMIDLTIAPPR